MTSKLVFLKTDSDFANFKRSKSVSSKNLRLRVHYNTNQNSPRFGFIIPKKVLIKVTDRNKVKRRLKSILQKNISAIRPGDELWFPQKTSLKLKFAELEQEAINLIKAARLWKH